MLRKRVPDVGSGDRKSSAVSRRRRDVIDESSLRHDARTDLSLRLNADISVCMLVPYVSVLLPVGVIQNVDDDDDDVASASTTTRRN